MKMSSLECRLIVCQSRLIWGSGVRGVQACVDWLVCWIGLSCVSVAIVLLAVTWHSRQCELVCANRAMNALCDWFATRRSVNARLALAAAQLSLGARFLQSLERLLVHWRAPANVATLDIKSRRSFAWQVADASVLRWLFATFASFCSVGARVESCSCSRESNSKVWLIARFGKQRAPYSREQRAIRVLSLIDLQTKLFSCP